jgi:hypothetical protein
MNRYGMAGRAMSFDGDGDKIILPGEPTNARTAGTLSLWMKVNGPTTAELCGRTDLGSWVPLFGASSLLRRRGQQNGAPALAFRRSGSESMYPQGCPQRSYGEDAVPTPL